MNQIFVLYHFRNAESTHPSTIRFATVGAEILSKYIPLINFHSNVPGSAHSWYFRSSIEMYRALHLSKSYFDGVKNNHFVNKRWNFEEVLAPSVPRVQLIIYNKVRFLKASVQLMTTLICFSPTLQFIWSSACQCMIGCGIDGFYFMSCFTANLSWSSYP
jgi:hypothetical protein